jgi:hypothetical protein
MKFFFVAGKSDWVKLRIGWLVFEDNPAIGDVNTGVNWQPKIGRLAQVWGGWFIPSFEPNRAFLVNG